MRLTLQTLYIAVLGLAQARKVTFPNVHNEFPKNCTLGDSESGVCAKDCGNAAHAARAEYKLCYFLDGVAYTCCRQPARFQQRTVERVCAIPVRHGIVLGEVTQPKEFPYMVALGWRQSVLSSGFDFKCGGVLIWHNFVLTAAHCAVVNGFEPDAVLLGGVNLTDTSDNIFKVKRVVIHPDYTEESIYNDIALLELEQYAGAVDKVACIWPRLMPEFGNDLTAIGYGHVSIGGAGSSQLLKTKLDVVPNAECRKFYGADDNMPQGIIETQLCAKDPANRSDTCQGDSGGPLIMHTLVQKQRRAQVVGITSFGLGCAFSPPGVYTRVATYIDWIESVVWPNGV